MANLNLSEPEMLEMKFIANCLEMLSFNTKFLLDNGYFHFFTPEMYASVARILTSIQMAKSQYINELRFDINPK